MASIDYTSRDFEALKASMLTYASVNFPDWVPGSEGDFGVLLLELAAYVGDVNSYYVDRAQNEAYLSTATQPSSVVAISQMLGYVPSRGTPATGTVTLARDAVVGTGSLPDVLVPQGTLLSTGYIDAIDGQVTFETVTDRIVPGSGAVTTGVVGVIEGQTFTDTLGSSSGLPSQVFKIPRLRVYNDTVTLTVAGIPWLVVGHLLDADAVSQTFEVFTDGDGFTNVRFGDDLNGAIPPTGLDIVATYRTGYGSLGNLPAGSITGLVSDVPGVSVKQDSTTSGLSTSSATTGGTDPETLDQIRVNAPRSFATQQRAVTLADFENFALGVPGVTRAKAVSALYFTSVAVYVIGPDGTPASSTLVDSVTHTLQERALAGVTVSVAAPLAITVDVGSSLNPTTIDVWPTYSREGVQYKVSQAIKNLLSFNAIDLGMKLSAASVYQTVMSVPGVRSCTVPYMVRTDASLTGANDIQFHPWEYPVAGVVTVTSTGGIG